MPACDINKIPPSTPSIARISKPWNRGAAGALDLCHLDEAGLTLTLPTTYSWMPRGKRLTVPYEATQNRRVNVIAAVITHGPQAGEFTYESYAALPQREGRHRNQTTRRRHHVRGQSPEAQATKYGLRPEELGPITRKRLVAFLWKLAGRPPEAPPEWRRERPLVVVLDNYSVHRNELIQSLLPSFQAADLYLSYLPPYSPELSAMEPIWRDLKYHRVRTCSHRELARLKGAVEQALYQKAQALLTAHHKTDQYLYLKT